MSADRGAHWCFDVRISFAGNEPIVSVRGEVDLSTAPELGSVVNAVIEWGHRCVVLDLAETSFMDAAGLRVIAEGAARLRPHGGGLTVRSPSALVARMLEVTGLAGVVRVEARGPNRAQAGTVGQVGAVRSAALRRLPITAEASPSRPSDLVL